MQAIRTREALEEVVGHGAGFIYNDFGGSDPKMCPVHTVDCTWVGRMLAVGPGQLTVGKVWSADLPELLGWLRAAGRPFSTCSFCNPVDGAPPRGRDSVRSSGSVRDVSSGGGEDSLVSCPSGDQVVEVWTARRLPFDPKGEMRELREQIRAAIGRLRVLPDSGCYALYSSPDRSFCDAENVLFYNVDSGSSVFSRLFSAGVCFERAFAQPPAPSQPVEPAPTHYHRYEVVARPVWRCWQPETVVGRSIARLPGGDSSVQRIWWQLQQCREQSAEVPQEFGLRVSVRNLTLGSTETLKRVLDGVVAAFHAHDGTQLPLCSRRLAARLGEDERSVADALTDTRGACLGVRRLLWLRQGGVQWNPADDQCVAATVDLLPSDGSGQPEISAEVLSVSEREPGTSPTRC